MDVISIKTIVHNNFSWHPRTYLKNRTFPNVIVIFFGEINLFVGKYVDAYFYWAS